MLLPRVRSKFFSTFIEGTVMDFVFVIPISIFAVLGLALWLGAGLWYIIRGAIIATAMGLCVWAATATVMHAIWPPLHDPAPGAALAARPH